SPAPPSRKPSAGGGAKWALLLILLVLVIAIVAGLVSLANNATDDLSVDDVIQQEIDQQIDRLDQFIEENTAPE
ncbi:MAG: hypothetical protein ACRDMA_18990, partial [Solirubrobacterales bacterium]